MPGVPQRLRPPQLTSAPSSSVRGGAKEPLQVGTAQVCRMVAGAHVRGCLWNSEALGP